MRFVPALSLALCLLALTPAAYAQGDMAAAEALFQEGRRLMDEGKSDEACPKLEESQRLDPGTGTLWHLGRCYQETGRLAKAWATYHLVAQEAKRMNETAKVKAALKRAKELEPKLHKLVIEVPEESRVEKLSVTRGGVAVGDGAWGAAVPVDLGELAIEAKAPGYDTWTETIEVSGEAKVHSITVPPLEKLPEVEVTPPTPATLDRPETEKWYEDKLGWAFVASGTAALGGGGGALLYSGSLEDDANGSGDLGERDRLFDQAESYQLAGGVLLAAGAGLALTGIVLLAVTPTVRDTQSTALQTTPQMAITPNGVSFSLSRPF